MLDIENIDLAALTEDLRRFFWADPPDGWLRGRTAYRDAIVQRLGCSSIEAEMLMETLESRGFLRFDGDPNRQSEADSTWEVDSTKSE